MSPWIRWYLHAQPAGSHLQ